MLTRVEIDTVENLPATRSHFPQHGVHKPRKMGRVAIRLRGAYGEIDDSMRGHLEKEQLRDGEPQDCGSQS